MKQVNTSHQYLQDKKQMAHTDSKKSEKPK